MSLTHDEARDLAAGELRRLFPDHADRLGIDQNQTRDLDVGWVFFWDSIRFLRGEDPDDKLIGNAPIVVDRAGRVHPTGTAAPLEDYLDAIRSAQD